MLSSFGYSDAAASTAAASTLPHILQLMFLLLTLVPAACGVLQVIVWSRYRLTQVNMVNVKRRLQELHRRHTDGLAV